ncbi:hypothetical protein L0222_18445 [bacterium]|nr:hypothetical protein [bacterium]MCI0602648.1 hypothetical protein [bacterium]
MAEIKGGGSVYKARKTPTKIYPSSPPKTPDGIEFLYHTINRERADQVEAAFQDRIVTTQILYKPAILAGARVNFSGNRWQIHSERDLWKIVPFPSKHQVCDWNENLNPNWNPHDSGTTAEPDSFFIYDNSYDFSADRFEELQEEFLQHLLSSVVLEIEYNPYFKMDRKIDESADAFLGRCMERARAEFEKEVHNLTETLHRLKDRLQQRLEREETFQDEIEAHDSKTTIEDIKREMEDLEKQTQAKLSEFEENLAGIAKESERDILRINRSHTSLLRFALIWLPYIEYVIQEKDSRRLELVPSF